MPLLRILRRLLRKKGTMQGTFDPETDSIACMAQGDMNMQPHHFTRHAVGDEDVAFDVTYCGICHTDLHFITNDLGFSQYPVVPGHEVVGVVTAVGAKVTKFKPGDKCAVGCMVESCLECSACKGGEEQYCATGSTFTYCGVGTYGRCPTGEPTKGGYANKMVTNEHFVLKLPGNFKMAEGAPLLCAGITMYDPLVHFGAGKGGKRVGIMGAGGLGMMGIKIAVAMGNEVTVISTSPNKEAASKAMGAKHFILASDADAMGKGAKSLDLILNTVSAAHDISGVLPMLAVDGRLVMMGVVTSPYTVPALPLVFNRAGICGSLIGGIKRTQECVDFCAKKDVYPEVEVIPCSAVSDKLKLLSVKNDQIKRYVIDIGNTMLK